MIPARTAALVAASACWDAWRLLAGRVEDGAGAATAAALAGALAWGWRRAGGLRVRSALPAAMLGLYALAAWTGPALLQIGAAVACLVSLLAPRGRWPLSAAALLALPVLPTLDFLLAYPLRRASAVVTAAMLRTNGVDVDVDGVALAWRGRLLLFDGPCSGVRMLWAAMALGSLLAAARGFGPARSAVALAAAALLALLGNALRASALFYLEEGFAPRLSGPVAHEAVGLAAFAMVGLATLLFLQPRRSPA